MARISRASRALVAGFAALAVTLPGAALCARDLASPQIVAQLYSGGFGMPSSARSGVMNQNNPIWWAGQKMNRTYELAGQMEHEAGLEAQAEAAAYQGMLDGTYSPVVRFNDGTTNVAGLLAKRIVRAGYHKLDQRGAEDFLNERQADYQRDVAAQSLPANSLTSACGYWVESLYRVGDDVHPSTGDLDQIRATCALTVGKIEKEGALTTNEQRFTIGRTLAMTGALFRTLAADPKERDGAVRGARSLFKSTYGYAIDDVPVSRFPCVLSDSKMADCDTIMSRYAARLPDIARRNT